MSIAEIDIHDIYGGIDYSKLRRIAREEIGNRLPISLTTNGNLRIAIIEDTVGIARETTLTTVRDRLDITLSALRDAIASKINELSGVVASTTTPLAANATYTSPAFTTAGWGRIVGSCFSDQAGVLRIEQSNDGGANWDVRSEFSYAANTPMGFSVEIVAPTARIVYINGATAQTVFRLYARLRRI